MAPSEPTDHKPALTQSVMHVVAVSASHGKTRKDRMTVEDNVESFLLETCQLVPKPIHDFLITARERNSSNSILTGVVAILEKVR